MSGFLRIRVRLRWVIYYWALH